MDFVAIDFETADANFPCEIGLTQVKNGLIIASHSWLIKPACFPYMNPWNERVHGISSADVSKAATFENIWPEVKAWLDGSLIVAHNAAFDMRVLRASILHYDLVLPLADYFCSVSLSRKTWKHLSSHKLGVVCDYHGIKFKHHRAGDDAEACAKIALKAFQAAGATSVKEGLAQLGVSLKRL